MPVKSNFSKKKCPPSPDIILSQALDSVTEIPSTHGWGLKQRLYIRWKYVQAKVELSALYF